MWSRALWAFTRIALSYRLRRAGDLSFDTQAIDGAECQRQSASAFGLALWLKGADIQLLSGALKEWVRTTPLGKRMACRFCPICGTRVFHQMLGQSAIMSIKPGTLNDTKRLEPVAHIWAASKHPWLEIPAGTLQFQEGPASFE